MPVAGVVVMTSVDKANTVLAQLQQLKGVTTYGIHKKQYIVAVIEGDDAHKLEETSQRVENIPGVLGVFPAYVGFDDELEVEAEMAIQKAVS